MADNTGTRAVVGVLGGPKSFPGKVRTWLDLHRNIEQGLLYRAADALRSRYGFATTDLMLILAVPNRTMARRKVQGRFRPEESDRLVRLGRVAALAEEALGDSTKAARWLQRPNRALANEVPLRQLDTDVGARQVEALLLRIAFGSYS